MNQLIKNSIPSKEFLIVHKSILPSYFDQIILAKNLIENHKMSVSDACKHVNISRSTYYKYKDYIFVPTENTSKKITMAIRLANQKGTLSKVLQYIASLSGNILSINQETPIKESAYVTLAIDASELQLSLDDFINKLKLLENIISVELLAVE